MQYIGWTNFPNLILLESWPTCSWSPWKPRSNGPRIKLISSQSPRSSHLAPAPTPNNNKKILSLLLSIDSLPAVPKGNLKTKRRATCTAGHERRCKMPLNFKVLWPRTAAAPSRCWRTDPRAGGAVPQPGPGLWRTGTASIRTALPQLRAIANGFGSLSRINTHCNDK